MLSPLSAELLALILYHLSPPAAPDLKSLFNAALLSKGLLPHVRLHMYRELHIDTRTNAHAMHRTLHGNDVSKTVKNVTADVGAMAKTSSQWLGAFPSPLSVDSECFPSGGREGMGLRGVVSRSDGAVHGQERTKPLPTTEVGPRRVWLGTDLGGRDA